MKAKFLLILELLRNECKLNLCFIPLYMLENTDLKICYLNARSLHKHIDNVRKDTNYLLADILIFKRVSVHMILMKCTQLMATSYLKIMRLQMLIIHVMGTVFSRLRMLNGYPYVRNRHGTELTVAKTIEHPDLIIIGIYRSPRVVLSSLLTAIRTTLEENPSSHVIFMEF